MKRKVSLRHKKMLKTIHDKHGDLSEYYSRLGKRNRGVSKRSGFGSDLIGEDGLTGHERAVKAGKLGGRKRRKFRYDPRTIED